MSIVTKNKNQNKFFGSLFISHYISIVYSNDLLNKLIETQEK